MSIQPQPPGNPSSVGAALGARSSLEDEYRQQLAPEIERFLREVNAAAASTYRDSGGIITLATVTVIWAAMLERVSRWLPASSALSAALASSDFPAQVATSAQQALATSVQVGSSASTVLTRLKTTLGLSRNPVAGMGGSFGTLLTGDPLAALPGAGSSGVLSWDKLGERWARTSATADFAESMMQQLRDEGMTHKRWSTRFDSRVRPSHEHADGQTVLLDESFIVGGSSLRFPGDPMGEISEVAQCRCVLIGVTFGRHQLDHPEGTAPWNDPYPG